jgi:hypothetical protein
LPVWKQNALQCVYVYQVWIFVGSSFYGVIQFQQTFLVAEQGGENRVFEFSLGGHKV